jgi:TPR repeat protein
MYLLGLHLKHDKAKAYFWLSIAIKNGLKAWRFRLYRQLLALSIPKQERIELDNDVASRT